ncbi:MAG: carboxylic ester hydrolase [Anaerolineae bacterium]|nr:carboxylic ester hydrolase [Anaerolineae bacterium]
MRPIETLLSLGNILTFCILAIPQLRAIYWMGYLALITVLIAVAQMLVEGPRWQMIPAYGLTVLFSLVWLLQNFAPMGGIIGQLLTNRFAIGLSVGLGVLGLAVATALPIILPIFRFPHPGGPYPIGTVTYHWVDTSRHEIFSDDPNARRELIVQIWYPARGDSASPPAPYMEDADAVAPALARLFHWPDFTFGHFRYVTTNAAASIPMATDKPGYPVLIFLTGLNGFRQSNTFQIEELVSYGYIVAAIDQPYAVALVAFPDGHQIIGWTRDQMQPFIQQSLSPVANAPMLNGQALENGVIPYFAQDVSFTLDQLTALDITDPNGILTGRLDLKRVGTFGISLGAMVASEACHMEPRLEACLMMDAAMPADVVRAGLRQPSMWITRDADSMRLERQRAGGWTEADITQTLTTMRAVFEKSVSGAGYYVQVPGMFHVNFTDAPNYTPLAPQLGYAGPIDTQRAYNIVNAYSLAFFDQYLAGRSSALLDGSSNQYPEVLFETRQP